MNSIKNILVIFIAVITFTSSNGFFFEQYLCDDCNIEHKEIAFFEFGELKHEHAPCSNCLNHGHVCDCSNNQENHEKHSDISYYSIDVLYSSNYRTETTPLITDIDDNNNLSIDLLYNSILNITNKFTFTLERLFKIPPLITQFEGSLSFCSIYSIFRL